MAENRQNKGGRPKGSNKILKEHAGYLEVDVSTPKYPDAVMLIDKEDWEYLKSLGIGKVYGHRNSRARTTYACVYYRESAHKIHRLIFPDIKSSETVDHVDGNGLDNRRKMLKVCSQRENVVSGLKRLKQTSKYPGVCLKPSGRWCAQIHVSGDTRYLGTFDDEEVAAEAYRKAAASLAPTTQGES